MSDGDKKVVANIGYAKDYRVVHADSALGGPTPRGEFRLEFTTTLPPPIVRESATVNKAGKIIHQELEAESAEILKERQVTVMMSRDTAKNILDMLTGLLKEGA